MVTDEYLKCIAASGAGIFYRFGSKIEHGVKKYNTLPPKDFNKWAVVCEHIIHHYTDGWANGFYYENTYWEIWNEPDLYADDSNNKRNRGGTAKQFFELYNITFNHLKKCFPPLKIGGPAMCSIHKSISGSGDATIDGRAWADVFMEKFDQKPDFFSWHVYNDDVCKVQRNIRFVREVMDKHGLNEAESILNEWNYVRGWSGEDWFYSKHVWKKLKGSAFIASTMEMSQYEPVDNLMFYDARPTTMNCMFNTDIVEEKLKGYYPFYTFNQLYKQGECVSIERESEDVWAVAAKGYEQNVMLTYYNDDDSPEKEVKVSFKNVNNKNGVRLEYYLLDENHDCEIVREEVFTSTEFAAYLKMSLNSTYLLKIVNL